MKLIPFLITLKVLMVFGFFFFILINEVWDLCEGAFVIPQRTLVD